MSYTNVSYNTLCEWLYCAEESLGEITCQFLIEVNLYGDGWLGSQFSIADAQETVSKLKEEIKMRPEYKSSADEWVDIEF